MTNAFDALITVGSPEETSRLAQRLAGRLSPGDVLLLEGEIGAGKTHFARSLIQSRLAKTGIVEDVPSPTFTLVQIYDDTKCELWHFDLYRLTHPEEAQELAIEEAFDEAICIIEWPDRLDDLRPSDALTMSFETSDNTEEPDHRTIRFSSGDPRWTDVLAEVLP